MSELKQLSPAEEKALYDECWRRFIPIFHAAPHLINRISVSSKAKVGEEAGSVIEGNPGYKYRQIMINGRVYRRSHLIWLMWYGEYPKDWLDHEEIDAMDDRISQLRYLPRDKHWKGRTLRKDNKSGHNGVYERRNGKWKVRIKVDGKDIYLGTYATKDEAIDARKAAERKYGFHKEHGRRKQ